MLAQLLAERLLRWIVDSRQEPLECLLGRADAAHCVVNSAGPETTLDDFEAAAGTEDHVAVGHADVIEGDMAVTVRGVVEAHDGEHAMDCDSGSVGGDEDNGLLSVFVAVVGVGFGHYDVDFAAFVAGTGRPPFLREDRVSSRRRRRRQGVDWRLTCPFRTHSLPSLCIDISILVASLAAI